MISLPISLLSRDERRKAEVAEYGEHLVVNYYTVTRSGCGGDDGWCFDREAIVKIKPLDAALKVIENILNAPPRVSRGR